MPARRSAVSATERDSVIVIEDESDDAEVKLEPPNTAAATPSSPPAGRKRTHAEMLVMSPSSDDDDECLVICMQKPPQSSASPPATEVTVTLYEEKDLETAACPMHVHLYSVSHPDVQEVLENECPITSERLCEPDVHVPHTPKRTPVIQSCPDIIIAKLPCAHFFNAKALLVHFMQNSMLCPLCRQGVDAAAALTKELKCREWFRKTFNALQREKREERIRQDRENFRALMEEESALQARMGADAPNAAIRILQALQALTSGFAESNPHRFVEVFQSRNFEVVITFQQQRARAQHPASSSPVVFSGNMEPGVNAQGQIFFALPSQRCQSIFRELQRLGIRDVEFSLYCSRREDRRISNDPSNPTLRRHTMLQFFHYPSFNILDAMRARYGESRYIDRVGNFTVIPDVRILSHFLMFGTSLPPTTDAIDLQAADAIDAF